MDQNPETTLGQPPRRPLRPLHGIPEPERRGREGWLLSGLFHAVILLALLLPPLVARQLAETPPGGAGGPGPAGGGGGGTNGTGGEISPEGVRYLQVAPAAPAPQPEAPQETQRPVPPPPEPEPEPEPETTVTAPVEVQPASLPASLGTTIPRPGSGGGSGSDGSGGMGPGSGGGIGTGVGTGIGSSTGPGTGGGGDDIYPPTVTNLAILPIPVPARVRPYRLVAHFEVDERGNAKLLSFNPSNDRGYNRKIREMLAEVRFRPATRADGTAVKDTAIITAEAP